MENETENSENVFLNNLPKTNGFSVPTGYFENRSTLILSKIESNKTLDITDNEGGFTVPVNYFETSKSQILSKVNASQVKKVILFTTANWQFVSGIAAIFIAIISLIIFVKNNQTDNLSANLNKVSEAEIIDYLANNDVKIEWINELNPAIKTDSKKEESNKEIEQYLLEHADEQALLDEL